jgi:hypothetical protein
MKKIKLNNISITFSLEARATFLKMKASLIIEIFLKKKYS